MAFDRMLVETMTPIWPLLDGEEKPMVITQVASSVTRAIAIAPFHIRLPVKSASLFLSFCIVFISVGAGGPLARNRRAERFYHLLQRFPGPVGSVVLLYRSMTLLAFYEQTPVAEKLLRTQALNRVKRLEYERHFSPK
ncbi:MULTISPECIES: hypothetical protein [Rhizobium]|uniref:Transmembrane protein n=1 Tax=Rhizobium mesoamericanum STM3625 TaxID=1211777 RepID=K0Q1F2_9HYPH|nr:MULTISPECIES: hypothetical protein [Rhizobium]MDQ0562349.1 hypothetical protein [Rhizobium mesoamericanum]CCM80198.1 conserved hypothetical protein [Rhizobium mesoamericanum STM3625]